MLGTAYQIRAASAITPVSVAGSLLPVTDEMKTLSMVLDSRLTFEKHVTSMIRSCNYNAMAIRHIRHLLTPDLVQKLACSLILSRLDYCNSLLHGAPIGVISKLQRMQNNVARIVVGQTDVPTPCHYYANCTGSQWTVESSINWHC